jgi:hypothetical protein
MIELLSNKLDIRINNYKVILNNKFSEYELNQYKIEKTEAFRHVLGVPKNQVVFWSKNCRLKYINEDYDNDISPILDPEAGVNMMFGTSAYFWFMGDSLVRFDFQIIQNKAIATVLLNKFENKIVELIGYPTSTKNDSKVWEIENQRLIIEFPHNIPHGYIHLMNCY